MKNGWLVALAASLALTLAPDFSEAKRMGGGKSSGMQRNMPARTAPQQTPPQQPAQPGQAAPAQAGAAATAGATAAAAGKRSWLGPIAGIAAGLGIAALLSHLGLGAGFANFLTLLLLGVAAFFLIRFLLRRFGPRPAMPAAAGAGANTTLRTNASDWQAQRPVQPAPVRMPEPAAAATPYAPQPATPAVAPAFVPATFDSDGFARIAKTIFIRLQAAHDNRDLDDLRRFTTPEMFAELKTELLESGDAKDTTDVVRVDADVLDVAQEDGQRIVSVRFRGQVREEAGAAPVDFDEVWHLVQPLADDNGGWRIAGIEQMTH